MMLPKKFNRNRLFVGQAGRYGMYQPENIILKAVQYVDDVYFAVKFTEHEKHEIGGHLTIRNGVKIKVDHAYCNGMVARCSPLNYEDFRDQVEPHIKNDTRKHNGIALSIRYDDLEECFVECS